MKRRALFGTLASLTVAGCLGAGDPGSTTSTGTTQSTTQQPTQSTTPPELRTLGVPVEQVDSPFRSDGNVKRVVWYPDHPNEPLRLTPETDEVSIPVGETTFTLANDTGYEFSLNFYDWSLHKRVDGEWFYVTPHVVPEPLHVLRAGGTHEWTFRVDNTLEPADGRAGVESATVAGLGGGEYAFEVSGWFETGGHEQRMGVGTRFRIDGDPLELSQPKDALTTRDGDTVGVTLDRQDGSPTEALVVEHVGPEGVPPEQPIEDFVAEQLVRTGPGSERPWLGDAFSFFDGDIATVRVESTTEIDLGRLDGDQRHYVQFRDRIFAVEVVTVE